MAIDSQSKRASVLGIVQPDGSLDQGDRQSILGVYRGILASELVLAVGRIRAAIAARLSGAAIAARLSRANVTVR